MFAGGYQLPEQFRVSEETVAMVQAEMTRAITTATGFIGYELEAPAKVIVPVITPLVNMIPRKAGQGIDTVHWKAITSFDTARSVGVLTSNGVPTAVSYSVVNMSNLEATIALSNSVDFEAQWEGRQLEGDLRARRVAELLYQLKIQEERWILTASQFLQTPARPLLSTAATGGSIAAATYWVLITAINAQGETQSLGQAGAVSVTTTGTTSTITYQIFTVPWATGYNVYVGSGASAPALSAFWLQATVSGNTNAPQPAYNASTTLVSGGLMPVGDVVAPYLTVTQTAAVASSGTALSTVSANTAKTFVDGSGNIKMWDGLIQQGIVNNTAGNGLTLTSYVAFPAAANGVLALSDIDKMFVSIYAQAAGDPDFLVMHPITHAKLTNLMAASNLRYVVEANNPASQGNLTAQYRVTHYLNVATGKMLPIIPDRYCPVDVIVAMPVSIPYPVPEVSNAIEIETNREYWGVDFAITGSNYSFADYVMETLKVYFLGGLGIIRGINPSL